MASNIAIFLILTLSFFTKSETQDLPEPEIAVSPSLPPVPVIGSCPVNALRLGVCASILNDLVSLNIGRQDKQCCSVLGGLVSLDAAVCLCTALKLNLFGVKLTVPIDISVLLNSCGIRIPSGYRCV